MFCLLFAAMLSVTPLDKADYRKTCWAQANPWFPFDMAPRHDLGGADVPWRRYAGENAWADGFRLVAEYGVNGIQLEVNEPSGGAGDVYRKILDQARHVSPDFRIALFCGFYSKTPQEAVANMMRNLKAFADDLKRNPRVARIGGAPVMVVYTPQRFKPEEWKVVFDGLNAAFGRMAYLLNAPRLFNVASNDAAKFEQALRAHLPYWDGVSSYAGSQDFVSVQRAEASVLAKVMKDFPDKVFEGGVFSTYTQHFSMTGMFVPLSKGWRESIALWLAADPDSINLTNLFDHYENSLVFPCYEREDLLLRYLELELCKWRGTAFRRRKTPELVLCNYNSVLAGWQPLDFEVLGFPVDADDKEVRVAVELCDASGRVLKRLGPQTLVLDSFRAADFSVPSMDFVGERAVVPRLVWKWRGQVRTMNFNPPTMISPSMRPNMMYWARSTKNALETEGRTDWTMDGVRPGGTRPAGLDGTAVFSSALRAKAGSGQTRGYARHTIRRDGVEMDSIRLPNSQLDCDFAAEIPSCGSALHWYQLELENALGGRFTTLPVWETDGSRPGRVTMAMRNPDGTVADREIEAVRVPFFHYPCDRDGGKLLLDVSGYVHNGSVNGSGYGGGHLGYTGYNHYHNGAVRGGSVGTTSLFRRDADGRGCLALGGSDCVMIMGGTAMPAACTYEVAVKPSALGEEQGILGSGRGHMDLTLLPDGRVKAARRVEPVKWKFEEASVVSDDPIPAGRWTHLQVVYDLRKMTLFVDGRPQGSVPAAPNFVDESWGRPPEQYRSHEYETYLVLGAKAKPPFTPHAFFRGCVRDLRVYGRNLAPAEFLR